MTDGWDAGMVFFVGDAGAAIDFYVDKLGFTLNWRHDEGGRTHAAGVSRGDLSLLLHANQPERVGKGVLYFGFGAEMFDGIRANLQARGVALKDGWWGKRLMIVEDPSGNQLWFADPHDRG